MLNVLTVLKSGGVYTPEWVAKTKSMCERNLPPYRFYCLSDMDVPDRIPIKHGWPGWWSKIELFRPDLPEGTNFYIDLDVLIMRSVALTHDVRGLHLLERGAFAAHLTEDEKIELHRWNSSIMMWKAGENTEIYTRFHKPITDLLRGDQDWIALAAEARPLAVEWTKLKWCKEDTKPWVDFVLCNAPKQHKAPHGWIREIWQ